jgi:hypothetical protein
MQMDLCPAYSANIGQLPDKAANLFSIRSNVARLIEQLRQEGIEHTSKAFSLFR